jgi:polyisoprenoid-binding protein YceI
MRMTRLSALLLLPALAAFTSAVETKPYVRDEAHSQINFSASSRLIDAQGFWGKWDAAIAFDPAAIDKTTLNITIDAKSVNTRVEMRDNHLKSKDFFNADSFPTITFVSKSVRATAGQPTGDLNNVKLIITGDLTIRGVTKTIPVPATLVFFDAKSGMGRVKGNFTILRKEYGVSYDAAMNPIENEVPVQFDITFKSAAPAK